MIRPISVASDGFLSNSLKTISIASNGFLISTVIPVDLPKWIYSVDHNLKRNNKIKEIIKREEIEIVQIISFIAKRIL